MLGAATPVISPALSVRGRAMCVCMASHVAGAPDRHHDASFPTAALAFQSSVASSACGEEAFVSSKAAELQSRAGTHDQRWQRSLLPHPASILRSRNASLPADLRPSLPSRHTQVPLHKNSPWAGTRATSKCTCGRPLRPWEAGGWWKHVGNCSTRPWPPTLAPLTPCPNFDVSLPIAPATFRFSHTCPAHSRLDTRAHRHHCARLSVHWKKILLLSSPKPGIHQHQTRLVSGATRIATSARAETPQ